MATLEIRRGRRGTRYRLIFSLFSKRYAATLPVHNQADAEHAKTSAEMLLEQIVAGRVTIPPGADVALFIATDGRLETKPTDDHSLPLGKLYDQFQQAIPEGHLERSTLLTMKIHLGHVTKILGGNKPLGSVTFDDLQKYVNRRTKEKNRRGKSISPVTIRKEVTTLSGMWSWAASQHKVSGEFPGRKLKYPATSEAPPFQTWDDIERQVASGAAESLWDCLFLNVDEVAQLLAYVKQHAYKPYVYPMLAMAAHTGARRSELIRSRVEDINFKTSTILLRERKRERGHHGSRTVPMSPLLSSILQSWLDGRKSGPTFFHKPGEHIAKDEAHTHLELTLADSKWTKLKGYHTLRHSMASNLAMKGVDQRVINEILGHMSERTAKRYRHFAPDIKFNAVQSVFG